MLVTSYLNALFCNINDSSQNTHLRTYTHTHYTFSHARSLHRTSEEVPRTLFPIIIRLFIIPRRTPCNGGPHRESAPKVSRKQATHPHSSCTHFFRSHSVARASQPTTRTKKRKHASIMIANIAHASRARSPPSSSTERRAYRVQ